MDDAVKEILAAVGVESKAGARFISPKPQDEIDRLEFSTEGLGRCLAAFLNNIRYIYKYAVLGKYDNKLNFNRERFWETYEAIMDAPKEDFEEFVSMKGLEEGKEVDGHTISELLLGTRNLSLRNKALHFASTLGINVLISRTLLDLFEYKNLDFEGVVKKYLSLREKLCQEVDRRHDGNLGAMILFYMDLGILLYVKGDNTCDQIAADEGVIRIIKARTEVAIDSAKYFKSIGRQEKLASYALSWSKLFRDKKRLVSDLEKLYDDLANKLVFVH